MSADEEPEFWDLQEAEEVMGALMHLYNAANESVRAEGPKLPPGWIFLEPPMKNMEPERPVSQWASVFSAGDMCLEEVTPTFEVGSRCRLDTQDPRTPFGGI